MPNPKKKTVKASCDDGVWTEKFGNLQKSVEEHTAILKEHTVAIQSIEKKVFNGFGTEIKNMGIRLDSEYLQNKENHDEIKRTLAAIMKFGATALIAIFVALLGVLGAIWSADHKIAAEVTQEKRVIPAVTRYLEGSVPHETVTPNLESRP